MKHFLTYLLVLGSGTFAYGQMGINTKNPHPSSVLDITSDVSNGNVGVLFPQVTTAERLSPTLKPTDRLLVYDKELQMFMYYLGGTWYALNGSKTTVTNRNGGKDTLTIHRGTAVFSTSKPDSNAIVVNGNMKVNGQVSGDLKASGNLTGTKVYGEGTMPIGAIIMWSGNLASLPIGWALCDGRNGTPNLKGRFIVGYDPQDPDYSLINKTGPNFTDADGTSDGSNTQDAKQVKLTVAQMPSHSHTGVTDVDGQHTHHFKDTYAPQAGNKVGNGKERELTWNDELDKYTDQAGIHSHSFTTNNTGGSQAIENRPPYYVLAYIIKLNY